MPKDPQQHNELQHSLDLLERCLAILTRDFEAYVGGRQRPRFQERAFNNEAVLTADVEQFLARMGRSGLGSIHSGLNDAAKDLGVTLSHLLRDRRVWAMAQR